MGAYPDVLYQNLLSDLGPGETKTFFPGMSTREAAAASIRSSLLKKLETKNSDVLDSRALLKFLEVNCACGSWSLSLDNSWDEVLVGELRRTLYEFFYPKGMPIHDSIDQCFHYGRTGPGAAVGARGGDFYTKMFSSPLTATSSGLYLAYKNYISSYPEWSNAEFIRTAHFGEVDVVEGSRLSFVPKNDKISRTICIEPSLNMFAQLGFGHILERRLLDAYGINLADQPQKNRELARRGSIGQGFVTIDLSSASDSMSLKMLEYFLPSTLLGLLKNLRSKKTLIPGLGYTSLDMVSSMGNGFTFPLQTIFFASIVVASARARGLTLRYPRGNDFGSFGVFGDDIICSDLIVRDVLRLLHLTGFKINDDKTFVEGPFRESCGSDFYNGVNIRGVYVKRLQTPQDHVSVINQLNLFSTRTGIKLPKTVQYLLGNTKFIPVPRWDNDDSGVKVPFSMISKKLRRDKNLTLLYRRYEPIGKRLRINESAIITPRGAKPRIYNPSGLYMSFLQRSVNSCSIGVRHDLVRYKSVLGVAPSWDFTPTTHPIDGWFNWQRWDTAVYLNLFS